MNSTNHKIFSVVVPLRPKATTNPKESAMKIYMYMHTNKDSLLITYLLLTEPPNNNGFKSFQK
jgi:hypothetical protein